MELSFEKCEKWSVFKTNMKYSKSGKLQNYSQANCRHFRSKVLMGFCLKRYSDFGIVTTLNIFPDHH